MTVIERNRLSVGHRERVTLRAPNGTKVVRWIHARGESWSCYTIVPRGVVIGEIRRLRAQGRSWASISLLECLGGTFIEPAGGGAPGEPFAAMPFRLRSSRRFVVIYQCGGLDI